MEDVDRRLLRVASLPLAARVQREHVPDRRGKVDRRRVAKASFDLVEPELPPTEPVSDRQVGGERIDVESSMRALEPPSPLQHRDDEVRLGRDRDVGMSVEHRSEQRGPGAASADDDGERISHAWLRWIGRQEARSVWSRASESGPLRSSRLVCREKERSNHSVTISTVSA